MWFEAGQCIALCFGSPRTLAQPPPLLQAGCLHVSADQTRRGQPTCELWGCQHKRAQVQAPVASHPPYSQAEKKQRLLEQEQASRPSPPQWARGQDQGGCLSWGTCLLCSLPVPDLGHALTWVITGHPCSVMLWSPHVSLCAAVHGPFLLPGHLALQP